MGAASKAVLVVVRVWQLICSVIVLGILAAFMNRLHNANGPNDGRIIYSIVTASISTAFSIIFIAPFFYSFLAFPFDFVLFVMWLVAFCLLESVRLYFHCPRAPSAVPKLTFAQRVGIHTCSSSWFTNYWGFYWGRWWRRPVVVTGPVNSGCGQWRTVLAFSFMAMFAFIVSTILVSAGYNAPVDCERTRLTSIANRAPTSCPTAETRAGRAAPRVLQRKWSVSFVYQT